MTFGTGATPYSCRISPTRGRIPMCPASWVQTPSTALPASSCNTSGRQRHRKADGSMWSCREMVSARSASSDGTRTRPCYWSGRYTGCCCWMATSTPSPNGKCCCWWRHYETALSALLSALLHILKHFFIGFSPFIPTNAYHGKANNHYYSPNC